MELLITVFIVYGISAIITISKIFEPLRDTAEKHSPHFWKYLTSCMQCLPFWAGIFVSIIMENPIEVSNKFFNPFFNTIFTYLFSGAFYSGTTMLIHTIFVWLKGDDWRKFQEMEKQRKIKKGVL